VPCPHKGTSVVGVNQRSLKRLRARPHVVLYTFPYTAVAKRTRGLAQRMLHTLCCRRRAPLGCRKLCAGRHGLHKGGLAQAHLRRNRLPCAVIQARRGVQQTHSGGVALEGAARKRVDLRTRRCQ